MIDAPSDMACHDCDLDIREWHGMVLLSDAHWAVIRPSDRGRGGLLCANCIMRRLSRAGLRDVPAKLQPTDLAVRNQSP